MATVIEIQAEMVDNTYVAGTRMEIMIFDNDPSTGEAIVSTAIADHLFVRVIVPISRDDGKPGRTGRSQWIALKESEIVGMQAGDAAAIRPILKRIYDDLKVGV